MEFFSIGFIIGFGMYVIYRMRKNRAVKAARLLAIQNAIPEYMKYNRTVGSYGGGVPRRPVGHKSRTILPSGSQTSSRSDEYTPPVVSSGDSGIDLLTIVAAAEIASDFSSSSDSGSSSSSDWSGGGGDFSGGGASGDF